MARCTCESTAQVYVGFCTGLPATSCTSQSTAQVYDVYCTGLLAARLHHFSMVLHFSTFLARPSVKTSKVCTASPFFLIVRQNVQSILPFSSYLRHVFARGYTFSVRGGTSAPFRLKSALLHLCSSSSVKTSIESCFSVSTFSREGRFYFESSSHDVTDWLSDARRPWEMRSNMFGRIKASNNYLFIID